MADLRAMESASNRLSAIVTADLLHRIYTFCFPWPKTVDPPISEVVLPPESKSDSDATLEDLALPALRTVSQLAIHDPSMLDGGFSALSDPSEAGYFTRTIGFLVLFDQCPRIYHADSANARWANAVFDPMVSQLVGRLLREPEQSSILNYSCWQGIGYTYKHFLVLTARVLTAAAHSEDASFQKILRQKIDSRRQELTRMSGMRDPFASKLEEDQNDVLAFSRTMHAGLPAFDDVYQWAFARMMISTLHDPIVDRFARYPWRNVAMGRTSTSEEKLYLDESAHFGEIGREAQEAIQRDIDLGRWTPYK